LLASSEENKEEEEGEQKSPSSVDEDDGNSGGGRGQNDRSDQRWKHEQWCRQSDDGVAMLANGTELARRDVDATSKQGDVRWTPLHCCIVDLLNSNITLSHYILLTCSLSFPSTTLNHAFGGPNHDDSVHVDAPTTIATPQTSSNICWQHPRYIPWVGKIYHQYHYWLDKNVEDVTPPTVKIVLFDNSALVSK